MILFLTYCTVPPISLAGFCATSVLLVCYPNKVKYWAAGMWVLGARTFKHSKRSTNGALESYHGVELKRMLNQDRKTAVMRNLPWLVWELEEAILPHYMHIVSF